MIASPAAYSPVQNPAAALERRNLVLQRMQRPGPDHHRASCATPSARRCRPRNRDPARRRRSARRPTSPPGSRTSSSTATGAGTPSAAASRSAPRSTSSSRRRPSRRSPGGSAASARAPRWSRSTTTPAASARWSAARTSSSGRSTSPRRAAASRARRSSRSPWSRRSRRASRPGRTFVSAPKTLEGPRGDVQGRELRGPLRRRRPRWRPPRPSSDNSVYAEVGYKLVGTRAIARVAQARWASARRSPRNPAMVLGGLKQGVTPLEMAQGLRDARRERQARLGLARAPTTAGRSPSRR